MGFQTEQYIVQVRTDEGIVEVEKNIRIRAAVEVVVEET